MHAHPPACVCLTQIGEPHRVVHNQGGIFADGVPEYSRIGLIRSRELGDLLAQTIGKGNAAMMRGHGITTAFPTCAPQRSPRATSRRAPRCSCACSPPPEAAPAKIRAFTREEAEGLRDQITGNVAKRAWEYFAAVALETR